MPDPPDGLLPASIVAWETWLGSWVGAHFAPVDLPSLRIIVRLYDQVVRGELTRANELRMWLDTYGLTPKGRQDRRWTEPRAEATHDVPLDGASRYAHLLLVEDPAS